MVSFSKLRLLLGLLPRKPREFRDRLETLLEVQRERRGPRPHYVSVAPEQGLESLRSRFVRDALLFSQEETLLKMGRYLRSHIGDLASKGPFALSHNADWVLGRFAFLVCRALSPEIVVETGVAYGVTTAFILQALATNQKGRLVSIDLPPLARNGDSFVGCLVPEDLRERWQLHRGTSRRLLQSLLTKLRPIDLFVHDSLHTYRTMRMEFEAVWPALRNGGVLISDDVEGNAAFLELARRSDVACSVVVKEREKDSLLGVAVKRG